VRSTLGRAVVAPRVRNHLFTKGSIDDLDPEASDAFVLRPELMAGTGMVSLKDAGAESELQATLREVIESDDLLGEYSWVVPDRQAEHQRAHADAARARGHRRQDHQAVEADAAAGFRPVQVVASPDGIESEVLDQAPPSLELRPRLVGQDVDAESHDVNPRLDPYSSGGYPPRRYCAAHIVHSMKRHRGRRHWPGRHQERATS
jgi:hypothetical protein